MMLLLVGQMAQAQNYEWVKQVGGSGGKEAYSMAIDSDGNAYIVGYFVHVADFDLGTGTAIRYSNNLSSDIFIAKYDNQGKYIWSRRIGGLDEDKAQSIAIDKDNNLYITGTFQGIVDFDPGNGIAKLTSNANSKDIFIAKYNSNGEYQWAHAIGGDSYDETYDLALDSEANLYITGTFSSPSIDFDPSANDALVTHKGAYDLFIAKYNTNGAYQWAHAIGSNQMEHGYGVATDAQNNVYVTGYFGGTDVDFDPSNQTALLSSQGGEDVFVVKYDSDGCYLWAFGIGGGSSDNAHDIAVDKQGFLYLVGEFRSSSIDFDPSSETNNLNSSGNRTLFLARYNQQGQYQWAGGIEHAGTVRSIGNCLDIDDHGNVYITGRFENTADFDFGSGTRNLSSQSVYPDTFFAKYSTDGMYQWAHRIGGSLDDRGNAIRVRAGSGDIYLVGLFEGGAIDFDPNAATQNFSSDGARDIFIAKYNTEGAYTPQKLISTGGNLEDYGRGIVLDAQENVYISGRFEGTVDFDPSPAKFELTSQGMADVFIAKYNSQGALQWAFSIGGNRNDTGNDIALDQEGNILIIGAMYSGVVDLDPSENVHNLTNNGSGDIFVAKYSPQGSLLWAHNIGGVNIDYGDGIATDALGNVYITGYFQGTDVDFNPNAGITNISSNGNKDIFFAKYDSEGHYQWVHHIGSTQSDVGTGIAVDRKGDVYLTGLFKNTVDFDPEVANHSLTSSGDYDAFIAKYDTDGVYQWAHKFGGTDGEGAGDIVTDHNDNVYITGLFQGMSYFDPASGSVSFTSKGGMDIFIAKYDTDGVHQWAHSIGGTQDEAGRSIEVDRVGNVYIAGMFKSANVDFDLGNDTYYLSSKGKEDAFVARYTPTGIFQWAYQTGGSENDAGNDIAVSGFGHGHIYLTGYFSGNDVDFHTNNGVVTLSSQGDLDFFYSKTRVSFCALPYSQPTQLIFAPPAEASISIQSLMPPTSTADGYLIKVNTVDSFSRPNNGALPTANPTYGSGEQVVYAAEGLPTFPLTVDGLNGNTPYYFKVYAFNRCGNDYLFETIGLSGNATTDRLAQSISFGALPTKTYGDSDFTLTAASSSGLGVSYHSANPAVATVSGNVVTITGAGSTTITATQTGNSLYYPASSTQQNLVVNKAAQTINFEALANKFFGNQDFSLNATATSKLTVTYSSSNPAVATVSAGIVTIVGTGATIITATQTGNAHYLAAASVAQILIVEKAPQSIQFDPIVAKTYGDAKFDLQATASSGLGVVFTIADPSIATINGNEVTILKAGTTSISASQAGNTNYHAASSVSQTLVVNKKAQAISFDLGIHTNKSLSSAPFVLTASASSGLPISFASNNQAVVAITQNVATITGAGTTTISASQSGNENYHAATTIVRPILVIVDRPTALQTTIEGRHSIKLLWKIALSQTQETRIERSAHAPNNFEVVHQVNAQTYLDSSLAILPDVTYYYRLVAIGAGGAESLPSDTIGVKIPKEEVVTGNASRQVKSIRAYPNPSHDGRFNLDAPLYALKNAKMILINPEGKVLKRFSKVCPWVDLAPYPNGVYLLKIVKGQQAMVELKLVKE